MTLFPSQESTFTVDFRHFGDTIHATKGFHALVGQSVTFQVGFFSDGDTGGPWTVGYDFPGDLDGYTAQSPDAAPNTTSRFFPIMIVNQ